MRWPTPRSNTVAYGVEAVPVLRRRRGTSREQILNILQAQSEAEINPNRLSNDFGREAVAIVADLLQIGLGQPDPREPASRNGVTMPAAQSFGVPSSPIVTNVAQFTAAEILL